MRKKRAWLTLLCCLLVVCMTTGVTAVVFAAEGDGTAQPAYTKVAFDKITALTNPTYWSTDGNVDKAIDGQYGTNIGSGGGNTNFFQTNEEFLLEFGEVKTIDRIKIVFSALPMHTQAWRVEVSKDKVNWGMVSLKENADTSIFNDSVVQNKSRMKGELFIDFRAAECKYVRLTLVIKESWGKNPAFNVAEIEAYTSGATAEGYDTWQQYAYTVADQDATWKQDGDVALFNDGKGKFFEDNTKGVVFNATTSGNATVTMTLTKKIVPSFVRLYPYAYETKVKKEPITSVENTYVINEDAFINTQVAKGLKFQGYTGSEWITLKEYNDIPSYIFAQNFDIATDKAVEKVRLIITEKGENANFVTIGEIEIFGNIGGDYLVLTEESGAKKTYTEGEELDLNGFKVSKITVNQETGEEVAGDTVAVTAEMVKTEFKPYQIGKQTMVVEYEGMRATFDVTVDYAAVAGTKIKLTNPTVNGTYHLTPVASMSNLIDGNKTGEVILGTWGETNYFNVFEPITFTIDDESLSEGKAIVDKMRVYFKPGNTHTARFMIEASLDGNRWATVNYKDSDDIVIENNAVGLKTLPARSDYMTVSFEPIYAKYLRVTYLIKNLDGGNALSKLTEIEAYTTDGATVTAESVYAAKQAYTYTTVSADPAGTTEGALNDGEKLYFGMKKSNTELFKPEVLVLYGGKNNDGEQKTDASVTFTLGNFINAAKIRLFPNGINAVGKQASNVVNEDALVNSTVPKAFKVEGSADGESWTTLGEYTDVKPYAFAQEFALDGRFTVKYLRLAILNTNELGGGSDFSEIEIFGNEVADFTYEKESTAVFKEGKLVYSQGEELDTTDLNITVTDNAGGVSVQTIPVTADMVKNFTTAEVGEQTATIEYNGLTCDYAYAVAQIDSVTVSKMPDKTIYFVGETLDVSGMEITVNYHYDDNGTEKTGSVVVTSVAKFVTLDTSTANNAAKLTVTYYGKTTTADVVVRDVKSIAVNSTAHKASYYVGARLDVTDLTIEITYTDDAKETVAVTADMVSGFASTTASDSLTLTVTYKGKTTTFNVEIKALPNQGGEAPEKGCGCGSSVAGYASLALAGIVLLLAFGLGVSKKIGKCK